MNLKTLTFDHIRLISLYWSRYAVRSGSGLVYLMIALVFGLSVVEESAMQQGPYMNNPDNSSMTGEEQNDPDFDPWTSFLLEEKPALLSAIFLVLLFGMPFVISFLAYNQVSGDIQSHGLRYLLLRTERSNIYFGRFVGTVVFSTVVMAIIVATITLYLGAKTRIYPPMALIGWAAWGFLALAILMVPYIAVCSMISASVDSPFLSLVLAKLIIAGTLILALVGGIAWKPAKYLLYSLPWGLQSHLLHPAPTHWLGAALACMAYTAVFLMLGYYRFEKRDI